MPSGGVDLEVVVGTANLHDTPAYMPVYTEIIPLLTPALDASMQLPLTDTQRRTVWFELGVRFDGRPLPDQARRLGQTFDLSDWDGRTVYTLSLPAGVSIDLPSDLSDGGCDSPFDNVTCCPDGTASGDVVRVIHTPTQTLVILPAIRFTWHLDDLNGYEYQDPIVRYYLHVAEFRGREVRFAVNYDPHDEETLNDPYVAFLYRNAALWTVLGEMPLHVTTAPPALPVSPSFVGAQVGDLWGRNRLSPSPATRLHLIAPMPGEGVGKGASMLNVTSILMADVDQDGVEEKLTDVPADRPVTACLYTAIQDWGRTQGEMGTLVLRIPWGLGYRIDPLGDSWEAASQSEHGYAVYSDTVRGYGEDWVRFRVSIPSWDSERITTCLRIQPYPHVAHEGYRTFFGGALYYYPFDLGSALAYELETSYVQAAWAVAHNPAPSFQALPSKVGRVGEELYYLHTLKDENDPRLAAPYIHIATYGGGTYANTTYLGDSSDGVLRDPLLTLEDEVILRVELSNGSGQEWTNVDLDLALPPSLVAEPYVPHLGEPAALNERSHLNLSTIADNGWAVYYYLLRATSAYTGTMGRFFQVPITVQGENLPADMQVPPARLAVVDDGGPAIDVRGVGRGLRTLHRFEDGFLPHEVRMATPSQTLALESAWYDGEEAASVVYTTLPTLPMQLVTDTGGTRVRLPDPADRLPAEEGPYTLIFHGMVSRMGTAERELEVDHTPRSVLTNHFGYRQTFTATGPVLPVRGPVLDLRYSGIPDSLNVPSATIRAAVVNEGDAVSLDPVVGFTLPTSLVAVSAAERCHAPVVISGSQVITCDVADLIPGGRDETSVAITVYPDTYSRSSADSLLAALRADGAGMANNLVVAAYGEYVNAFTGREEFATLPGAYAPYRVMLPLVQRDYHSPRSDLVVESLSTWPPSPDVGEPAVISITITNVGPVSSGDDFWVDLYLNPEGTPAVNVFWNQICDWGIAWHVHESLEPGESIVLTSESFDDPERPGEAFSRWPGYFPMDGAIQTFVLVDSFGDIPYGRVNEESETNNLLETTVVVTSGD
jgi:hypothetical protein